MDPLVSVITPTLDRAPLLAEAMRSLEQQSYRTFEHIVVDGGSEDGTVDLLRGREGAYPLRWVSEPDDGIYQAVNKGLRLARGELLAYLNSDDLYFPWTLEVVARAFAEHPEADLVYGDAIRLDERVGMIGPAFQPPFSARHTAAAGSLIQPAVFWRRRLLEDLGGFDERLRYVADLDFWLRAAQAHRLVRIDEFLALERVHPSMVSLARHGEMASENRRMRGPHRHSRVPLLAARVVARARAEAWWRVLWLRFVRAAPRAGAGPWGRTIDALRPEVGGRAALAGLVPGPDLRPRAAVSWGRDPLGIAAPLRPEDGTSPLVSIVTPTFRQAGYLPQALRSVHEQDYPRIEHIVVDGGSDDETVAILRQAEQEWGVRWVSEPDRGQAHAINKGWRMARGDIVSWLNADDLYLGPQVVSLVVERFRRGARVVTGAGMRLAEDGRRVGAIPLHRGRLDGRTLRRVDWLLQPATFFSRELALAHPLDESLRYALDWDLFVRLAEAAPIDGLDLPIAGYRIHRGGKTVAGGAERQRELLAVLRRYHAPSAWNVRLFAALVALYGRAERLPGRLAWVGTRSLNAFARLTNLLSAGRGLPM